MHPILSLFLGLVCAALGGELFVRGAVGLARWAKIPAGIIGATVAAFATSSPELTVSIQAARTGTPQIALGDALGSNVVNVGLILGLALLFGPIRVDGSSLRRDFSVAVLAPLATAALALDGELSRTDAAVLLFLFILWLAGTIRAARRERSAAPEVLSDTPLAHAVSHSLIGLILLILAGTLIVTGAKFVGGFLGWSTFATGAILVSIGTSAPELATTIVSRVRGHDEVGLGTVLGSNIFNGLFVVALAGLIYPISVGPRESLVGLGFGVTAVLAAVPTKRGNIGRRRGIGLLAIYVAYLVFLLWKPWSELSVSVRILILGVVPTLMILALAMVVLHFTPRGGYKDG